MYLYLYDPFGIFPSGRDASDFNTFHVTLQLSSHHFFKNLIFLSDDLRCCLYYTLNLHMQLELFFNSFFCSICLSPHALTLIYFKYKGFLCFSVQPGKPNSILFFLKVLLSIHAYLFCQLNFIILTRWLGLENNLMIFYLDYITCINQPRENWHLYKIESFYPKTWYVSHLFRSTLSISTPRYLEFYIQQKYLIKMKMK